MLPMLGWSLTGMVFFIKPGYQAAYAPLSVKKYPLELSIDSAAGNWQQATLVRTVLGHHLLVEQGGTTQHLNPDTLQAWPTPNEADVKRLIDDAIADKRARYGQIAELNGSKATTTTGARITLDWSQLRLSQYGRDTALIDTIYRVHYLQWTPSKSLNQVLGFIGLILLIGLTLLGLRLYLKGWRR